jgi:uncharacterized protein DUF4260
VNPNSGFVAGQVRTTLRLEGLCVLVASCAFYAHGHFPWGQFFLLFLLPDISFLGYLAGPKTGAVAYNAAHSYILPVIVGGVFFVTGTVTIARFLLIWVAHIGFDRALGYGLKYAAGFSDTHLGKISRLKKPPGQNLANA